MGSNVAEPWVAGDEGAYDVGEELGSGAYGTVWCARHRATGRQVAMKKIRVRLSEEGVPQSLIREVSSLRHLGRFHHENIVELFEVIHSVEEGHLCVNLIFEKCDWDLYDFLQRLPRDLPEHQIRLYAGHMLSGLDFLHSQNIIHRDLKPQNILVNANGIVKIHDFGLARTYTHLAAFTTVVVTLWYRAPELLLQSAYASPVDLFSIGCIFAELHTRRALFAGRSEREQLGLIFAGLGLPSEADWPRDAIVLRNNFPPCQPQPMEALVPGISEDAADLLKGLLALAPQRRLTAAQARRHSYLQKPTL